jgi:hypothetical protein
MPGEQELFDEWSGNQVGGTLGRVALGESVRQEDLFEAVEVAYLLNAETEAELFSPHTRRLAELFCTP